MTRFLRLNTLTTLTALIIAGSTAMSAHAQSKPEQPADKPAQPLPLGPGGGVLGPAPGAAGDTNAAMRAQVITATPTAIELGEFSTSETKAGTIKLKNTADQDVTIRSAKASCGCTTADFKRNTVLKPGEETEVTVRMRGGPTARVLNKTVTFTIDGYPQLKVPVKGKSIAYVKSTPERIGVVENADGKIVFESIDEQPFKVLNVQPNVLKGELPKEPAAKHTLNLDWDKFRETAVNTRLTFYFDHPKASQHMTIVKVDPATRADIRANAEANRPNRNTTTTKASDKGPLGAGLTASGTPDPSVVNVQPRQRSMTSLVRRGSTDELKQRIADGGDVNATDDGGVSLLSLASKEGNVEMMTMLIESGADVNAFDKVGRTALMNAGTSKSVEAVRVLIESGADVNARDNFIGGALAWTSAFGSAESVQDLLDAGAQVQTVGSATGFTPLIWASGFGDENSIPLLLEAGANIEATDGVDRSRPLMHAAKTGKIGGMRMLLTAGADVNATNNNGRSALLEAASHPNGSPEKIALLIEQGADLNATDNSGKTALDLARGRTDGNASKVLVVLEEAGTQAGSGK
ncbi:MAG: ankyrin repeat domain-containing protein [Phycisphaerales bacterium]|nr:ankyrin repeat domain-containing protein [Phycisphaerales bacterium]